MEFSAWFRTWLTRHPLKEPQDAEPARYTAQVMARVKALHQPVLEPARSWLPMPRLVFAAAAAGVVLAVTTVNLPRRQLAELVVRDSHVLASLGELDVEPINGDDATTLASEAEAVDTFQIAESTPSDEEWLKQTLQLLDQANDHAAEASPADASDPPADENWLNELEMLDESEFSASS